MTKGLAFTALLHGDAEEYMLYALVLGRQLKRHWSTGVDRVLLLGPGKFSESQDSRNALRLAGWTHLKTVDLIDKPHLDKTGSKRHRLVFMKLRALELSYKHVLFLDLDLLPRSNTNLAELFNIQAIFDESICWVRPCQVRRFGFVDRQVMGSLSTVAGYIR